MSRFHFSRNVGKLPSKSKLCGKEINAVRVIAVTAHWQSAIISVNRYPAVVWTAVEIVCPATRCVGLKRFMPRLELDGINVNVKHRIPLKIVDVHCERDTELAQIAFASCRTRERFRLGQSGQKHRREGGDDRDDDEQFDERETEKASGASRAPNGLTVRAGASFRGIPNPSLPQPFHIKQITELRPPRGKNASWSLAESYPTSESYPT
jgi:hypothetical protein